MILQVGVTDDDTPPIRPASPEHVESLAARLRRDSTHEERALAEIAGLSDVQGTPARMFVKVALMADHHDRWFDRIERAWKRSKRYVLANVVTAATTLAGIGIWWVHADEARVAEVERAAAGEREFQEYRRNMERDIGELRLDVRELRAALHRLGVADSPYSISIVQREEHAP